ncbi:MAG: glycogen synthase GlgA [Lachnospiraceae bacterium]|nr:glycogen synthase GlgA [Lachnospiraceae bacterium]
MKNILFAASESVPFVKTGGLADVVGSLPYSFDPEEYDVRVVLPCYTMIPEKYRSQMRYLTHFYSFFNGCDRYIGIKELVINGITFYFIDNEEYFGGAYPYTDYYYDIEKFCFFSKAVLSILPSIGFRPDIIHCHDWHSGLVPVYLKTEFAKDPFYRGIRSVMTIHNLKFQGVYGAETMQKITGLPAELFSIDKLLTYRDGNMLKGGLVYADRITTVSPTYAEEIKTPEYGEGLEGLFRARSHEFTGILNGIDFTSFDPEKDPALARNYTAADFKKKKVQNKLALQKELGLEQDNKVMMIGIVSRLTEQKGLELVAQVLSEILSSRVQLVVLGTGEYRYEDMFRTASRNNPKQVSANFFYSEELSRRIYASSDAFLMPSRFEPCGLSQLIALRYGTLPIVRETGGLKDTVVPYNRFTGEGTGFSFEIYNPYVFLDTVRYSLKTFYENKKAWNKLAERAMAQDFSWTASAKKYEELYTELLTH